MVEGRRRLLEKLKAEGKPVPWGRKRGGVNRSAAERQLARATEQYARRDATWKHFSPRSFGGASSVPTGGERRFDAVVRHSGVARSAARG